MEFTGKTVLVTGASRGIGRAIAAQFAEAGATVAVHYHGNRTAAEETMRLLGHGEHRSYQADQSEPEQAQALMEEVIADFGRLDILVNNAGIGESHPLQDVEFEKWQEAWRRTLAVNLLGPANLTYWAARHMMEHGGGRIVNISSRGAFRGEPEAPAYAASKAALNAMSQSLAKALASYGVFICVVAPGWVQTDMAAETLSGPQGAEILSQSPLGRVATPDEVARTVLFLASEGTDSLTGCVVDVNGASYLRT